MLGVNLIADDSPVKTVFFNKYLFCSLSTFWKSGPVRPLYRFWYHLAALSSSVCTHMWCSLWQGQCCYCSHGLGSALIQLLKANVLPWSGALAHRKRIHVRLFHETAISRISWKVRSLINAERWPWAQDLFIIVTSIPNLHPACSSQFITHLIQGQANHLLSPELNSCIYYMGIIVLHKKLRK